MAAGLQCAGKSGGHVRDAQIRWFMPMRLCCMACMHAVCRWVGWATGALGEIVRSVDLPSSSLLRRLWHGV